MNQPIQNATARIPQPHTSSSSSLSAAPPSHQHQHQQQPQHQQQHSSDANGLLLVRICEARGVPLPPGIQLPGPFARLPIPTTVEHVQQQRKACWWFPYAVLEFDRNEIVIDALGGDFNNPIWQYRANFDVSRQSEAVISLYMRTSPPNTSASHQDVDMSTATRHQHNAHHPIAAKSNQPGDVLLGSVRIRPDFAENKVYDQWFPLTTLMNVAPNGVSSQPQVPSVHVQMVFKRVKDRSPLSIDSFDLLKVIGKGSFGKVMQVRKRDTNRIYAMKILRKQHIIDRSEVHHTLAERTVLARLNNPFIVSLKFSFQSPDKLYLVLAFVNGGELFHHLQREGRFDERRSKFYTAELLCALECLHGYNVIYRDLKPENILLDYNGHIALCDFGLCKLNMAESDRTHTFCGTPEYLAPELLLNQGYTKTVDWWTLGILLFEMLTGLPPFYDEVLDDMYVKILQQELRFPEEVSPAARSLLSGLLTRNPNNRLGANGPEEIKAHPFFADIDWRQLMAKRVPPPFKPTVQSAVDTSNFDDEFTKEVPQDSVVADSHLSQTAQNQFAGFTYDGGRDGAMAGSMGTSYRSMGGARG